MYFYGMEELKRLESIKLKIYFAKDNEERFNDMYHLMQEEFPEFNLKGTQFKEARVYMGEKQKHPNRHNENLSLYNDFLKNFTSFVDDKILTIK